MVPDAEFPGWVQPVKRYLPSSLRLVLKEALRQRAFSHALDEIRRLQPGEIPGRSTLTRLRVAWANEGWSGQLDYLEAVAKQALATAGPILECGSGLTTILLGLLAGRRGVKIWSLEDSNEWHHHVSRAIAQHKIAGVNVCRAPLREYDDFIWYTLPSRLPEEFSLVICDGPGVSYASRYGVLPVLGQRLAVGALVLVDDSSHMTTTIAQWLSQMPVELVAHGPQVAMLRTVSLVKRDPDSQ